MNMLLDTLKWSVIIGAAALALTLLKPLLDRRYSPRWRYGVWLAMAALLLAAPVLGALPEERAAALPPAVVIEVPQVELRVSREEGMSLRRPGNSASPAAPGTPVHAAPEAGRALNLDVLLPGLWLLGAAAFLLYHLTGTLAFQRRARRWSRPAGAETAEVYEAVRRELGIKSAPPLAVSSAVDSPMVLGLLRPRLLLPGEDWEERELRFILRHELIHFRRRDLWYKLLILLANAVHWFNPLVHLMAREAAKDVELTCDALVVDGADPETRRAYSETLLSSIHRQRGLSRSALSTHFYGGAQVMRERFRNILGRRGRRWGAAVLALTLLATLAAACAVGVSQAAGSGPLTEAELSQWQEKLNSAEWNGFLSRMYTDVGYLNPEDLFYDGAGIGRPATEEERSALEARGEPVELDVLAMDVSDIDQYLADHAGVTRAGFAAGAAVSPADGKSWRDLEPGDTHFAVHGDTNFVAVTVTGGTREGDTVTLTVEADQNVQSSFSNGLTAGTLTLVDGKVRSFTTPLYSAAEREALAFLDSQAEAVASFTDDPPVFEEKYIADLYCAERVETEERTYYVWNLSYRMLPDNMGKVVLAGGMSEENGWVTESSSVGTPVLILSADGSGSIALEELAWTSATGEEGFTWEEYVCCHVHLGMELSGILNGWPEVDGAFLDSLAEGHETWTLDWDDVAHSWLEAQGQRAAAELTVLRTFQSGRPEHDQSVLVRADCGGGNTATLLLTHALFDGAHTAIWQVNGAVWSGETPPAGEAGGDPLIHQADFTLTEGRTGTVYLYGQEQDYGWGVSRLEVALADGNTRTLSVRDALSALGEEGERTEAWNADGGLVLEDLNFDGYADIGLQAATPAYNLPCLYWLYNPASGQHEFAFRLLNPPTVDSANRRLVCESRNGTLYYTEYYVYDPSGTLYLAQRDTVEYGEAGSTPAGTEYFEKPAYDWQGGSCAELTAAELASFADYFNTVEHNGLLRFPYRSAEDLGPFLWVLLYDHNGGAADMTAEEIAAVEKAMDAALELDARKLTRTYVKDYLAANYLIWEEADGLIEDFGDTLGIYLPEYDAYYSQRGDTEMRQYAFESGMRFSDGSVTLYYTAYVWDYSGGDYSGTVDQGMCVTLLPNGSGGWYVTSNYVNE